MLKEDLLTHFCSHFEIDKSSNLAHHFFKILKEQICIPGSIWEEISFEGKYRALEDKKIFRLHHKEQATYAGLKPSCERPPLDAVPVRLRFAEAVQTNQQQSDQQPSKPSKPSKPLKPPASKCDSTSAVVASTAGPAKKTCSQ